MIKKSNKEVIKKVLHIFLEKHFDEDADYGWVADEVGGVVYINGFYFDLEFMIICLKLDVATDFMIDFYYYALDQHKKDGTLVNIENMILN